MKIIAIGDTHGRATWKQIVEKNMNANKIVFIGDYFDSFDISGEKQIENFKDIIQFKRDNIDKVVLLIGNHDFHYMEGINEQYSGFQKGYQYIISGLLKDNMDILQMCYMNNKYLFTHAGVTNTWLNNVHTGEEPLDIFINDLFKYTPNVFKFTSGSRRDNYGNETCQTPIWVRPESLRIDGLSDFVQVVGHTQTPKIVIQSKNDNIILIDDLGYSKEYLEIIDNVPVSKNI